MEKGICKGAQLSLGQISQESHNWDTTSIVAFPLPDTLEVDDQGELLRRKGNILRTS